MPSEQQRRLASASDPKRSNHHDDLNEDTPLLRSDFGDSNHAAAQPAQESDNEAETGKQKGTSTLIITVLCLATLGLIEFGSSLAIVPVNHLLELAICYRMHGPDADAFPSICQGADVRGQLAQVLGWSSSMAILPSLLASVPYGLAADRYGRKPIIVLSTAGIAIALSFQVFAVYLSLTQVLSEWAIAYGGLFMFIGGGAALLSALLLTTISDSVSPKQRTIIFCRVSAMGLFCALVAGPLSGRLMSVNVWLPLLIGLGLVIAAVPVAMLIPETGKTRARSAQEEQASSEPQTSGHDSTNGESHEGGRTIGSVTKNAVVATRRGLSKVAHFFSSQKRVASLLFTYVVVRLIDFSRLAMLLQYLTKKFSWTWEQASYVASVGYLTNLVMLLAILPFLSSWLERQFKLGPSRVNLILCRGFTVTLALGNILFGLASQKWLLIIGLVPYAASQALVPLLHSMMIDLLDDGGAVALLNTIIAVGEQLTLIVGAPLTAWLLKTGFDLGDPWMGMPYIVNAVMAVGLVLMLLMFRL